MAILFERSCFDYVFVQHINELFVNRISPKSGYSYFVFFELFGSNFGFL